eukprot:COSAG01_NODE_3283_length_6310_cov_8.652391_6_plen_109_part_00
MVQTGAHWGIGSGIDFTYGLGLDAPEDLSFHCDGDVLYDTGISSTDDIEWCAQLDACHPLPLCGHSEILTRYHKLHAARTTLRSAPPASVSPDATSLGQGVPWWPRPA